MTSVNEYRIRPAGTEDAAVIAAHRARMFREMGLLNEEEAVVLRTEAEPWLRRVLAAERYVGWLVEYGDEVVAGGGVLLQDQGPVPGCLHAAGWAHVANLFTSPAHRRRGLARQLMQTILDWCENNDVEHITLNASEQGGALYEALGFKHSSEFMKLVAPR